MSLARPATSVRGAGLRPRGRNPAGRGKRGISTAQAGKYFPGSQSNDSATTVVECGDGYESSCALQSATPTQVFERKLANSGGRRFENVAPGTRTTGPRTLSPEALT